MSLAIGEVAQRTGLAVTAVRYYDRLGLITASHRVGGKRRFDEDTVGRVNFIRRAGNLGFTLEETRSVLDDVSIDWSRLIDSKRAELTQRRNDLDLMLAMLDEIEACGCDAVAACPVAIA